MLLTDLPIDVLECILFFLDSRPELSTACLICSRFCCVAQPTLYRNLHDFKRLPKSRRLEDAEVRIAVTRACRTIKHKPHLALGVRSLQLDFTEKLFQKPDRDVLMPPYTRLVCQLLPGMTGLRSLRIISSNDEDFRNLLACDFRLQKLAVEGSMGSHGVQFLRQQPFVEDVELYCDIEAPLPEDELLLPRLKRYSGMWSNAAYFVPSRPIRVFVWSGNRANLETLDASRPACLALSTGPIEELVLVSAQISLDTLPAILRQVPHVVNITIYVLWRDCYEIMHVLQAEETQATLSHLRRLERLSIDGRRMQQVSPALQVQVSNQLGQACHSLSRIEFKGYRKGDPSNWDAAYCRSVGGPWVNFGFDPFVEQSYMH